jgi:hypothetical protein
MRSPLCAEKVVYNHDLPRSQLRREYLLRDHHLPCCSSKLVALQRPTLRFLAEAHPLLEPLEGR